MTGLREMVKRYFNLLLRYGGSVSMQFGVALSGGGGGGGSPAFVAHCGKTAKAVTAAFNHVSGNISKSKPQMM